MSRYSFRNKNDDGMISYGVDLATGGYFWQYFLDADKEKDDEVSEERDGLSLTSLVEDLKSKFDVDDKSIIRELIHDFYHSPYPTQLQINVGEMFNRDVVGMLEEVKMDVISWSQTFQIK